MKFLNTAKLKKVKGHPLHRGCGLKFADFDNVIFDGAVTLFTEGVD